MNIQNPTTQAAKRHWLVKVPEITLAFWLIKILSTTVGETAADYLAVDVGLGLTVTMGIMMTLLLAALAVQFRSRQYTPWRYWLVVVLISIVGTQITDFLTDHLGVSLYVSTGVFSGLLVLSFWLWHKFERTLSIHDIDTPRREMFYWITILCTFALGTAAGDLATEAFGLGFTVGSVLFGVAIALTWVSFKTGGSPVLTFWVAYVITRPFGASLGDLLTQPKDSGGLDLGTMHISAIFLSVIIVLVTYAQLSRKQS
ncbi:COG4705 family protein [Limnobacter litoralis]|uniref:Membrane protein n=1 Tax=Limnobacter litoralis TaxID=481366 RepID=A0ABQ5YR80_9BURK|nr:hypothetical protein [Limnobacter litoralis]GLR25941.1 membrane protein [Limnobacter litoralis]